MVSADRERYRLLRETADRILADLPAWDGESPAVLVTVIDPETRQRLGHWFTPAVEQPAAQPTPPAAPGRRHLRRVV